MIFKLSQPVQFGQETITEITLQPIKAKHIRSLSDKFSMGDMLDLAVKVSGQPSFVIDELCASDAMELLKILGNELGNSQATGASA